MHTRILDRKNILVIGGAGFIGSHLCDALIKHANVICLDNFSTGNVSNIDHLLQNPNFEFLNHDITQPLDLLNFEELNRFKLGVQGIQEIYHLACPISKRQFEEFKISTVLTNSIGTKNILDIAVNFGAKILYASSSALYGPRREGKDYVTESDPTNIDHLTSHGAYDEGKRFSEAILQTYADVYKLDVKIARLFRCYGPRMKIFDGNLLPDIVNSALDGEDIILNAHDDARICLCYVTDMVDAMVKHMNTPVDVTVVNVGSDQEYRLSVIAEKIITLTESKSRVRFEAGTNPFVEPPLPDISKARQVLHWLPLMRLDDGLKQLIEDARFRRRSAHRF